LGSCVSAQECEASVCQCQDGGPSAPEVIRRHTQRDTHHTYIHTCVCCVCIVLAWAEEFCVRVMASAVVSSLLALRLRRPNKCQKRPTIGAKETYCVRTFESLPALDGGQVVAHQRREELILRRLVSLLIGNNIEVR